MKTVLVGLAFVGVVYAIHVPPPVMKDAVANEEKKMILTDLDESIHAARESQKEQVPKVELEDPMDLAFEPTAEESAPEPVIVQRPDISLKPAYVKEYSVGDDPEIEKLPELPFDIDSIPETKNPEDPCRKIRDLTTRWRELGREIAQRTAELVRVRGEERQKVREQIRKIREDMSKTNALIRENTRDCARTRRPTLRPTTPEV
ncbi:hypothetical protein BIW11_11789 [Tropilaelaps mercedesae]|uniref:Uncharacterized protein n=1 Tax=Tropilaelaps mercedesae TaxID=418985 RepID=A0A1V9X9I4_9ACAR|nr:hypothetical protein BIW11_11789 [Tropilaelaps mercedesae]